MSRPEFNESDVKTTEYAMQNHWGWWGFFGNTLEELREDAATNSCRLCESVATDSEYPYRTGGEDFAMFYPVCFNGDPLARSKIACAEGKGEDESGESGAGVKDILRHHLCEHPEDAQELLGAFERDDVLACAQSILTCSDLCALLRKWSEDRPEDVEDLLDCFENEDLDRMCRDRILDDTSFEELAESKSQGDARDFVLQYLNDNL